MPDYLFSISEFLLHIRDHPTIREGKACEDRGNGGGADTDADTHADSPQKGLQKPLNTGQAFKES